MLWPVLKYFRKKWRKKKVVQIKSYLVRKKITSSNIKFTGLRNILYCRKTFKKRLRWKQFPAKIIYMHKEEGDLPGKRLERKSLTRAIFNYFQWRTWFIIPASRQSCFLFTLQGCVTFCFSCPVELLQLTMFLEFGLMKSSISLDSVKSMYQ